MTRFDRKDILPVVMAVLAFAALVYVFWPLIFKDQPPAAFAQPAYDHSNCQYPLRLSNPPDGCDNSDPARPECVVKYGTEDCNIPLPDVLESSQPSKSPPAASHVVKKVKASACNED